MSCDERNRHLALSGTEFKTLGQDHPPLRHCFASAGITAYLDEMDTGAGTDLEGLYRQHCASIGDVIVAEQFESVSTSLYYQNDH